MISPGASFMIGGVYLLISLAVAATLFVLARRSCTPGLGWLCLAVGIWPIVSLVVRQVLLGFVAARYAAAGMSVVYLFVGIPLSIIGAVLVIIAGVRLSRIGPPLPAEPRCPQCGYNVTGLPENRCPECGTRFACELRYLMRRL